MIGRPEWFELRDSVLLDIRPKVWQGWAYFAGIFLMVALEPLLLVLGGLGLEVQLGLSILCFLVFLDLIDIIMRVRKDERQNVHEALAERNGFWFVNVALFCWLFWLEMRFLLAGVPVDFSTFAIVTSIFVGGMLVRMVSRWYLRDK